MRHGKLNKSASSPADDRRDLIEAWSCAANCLLYEQDPGPAQLNVGSELEPHFVSRSAAWRDFYARFLINRLDASHARLTAAAEACRRELTEVEGADALAAERRETWRRAIDLCDLGARIVADAGAISDEKARQRLLAGNDHMLTVTAFRSAVPELVHDGGLELTERLRAIDQNDDTRDD